MKNLKLLLLTLMSVLTMNVFAQNMVYTTPTSGPNVCDGVAVLDSTNVPMTSILWQGMGAIIGQGSYVISNLCPGTYTVIFTINGNAVIEAFTITSTIINPTVGDTLIINAVGMCNNPIGTLTSTVEDCNLNYNSIDSAFLSSVTVPQNPLDSVLVTWTLVDTNGVNQQTQVYTTVPTTGCYNFQLIVYCYQKSMNYKTIIANQTWYMDNVGLTELSSYNKKQVVKVLDLMGRETTVQSNKVLVYVYSDGTRELKCVVQ